MRLCPASASVISEVLRLRWVVGGREAHVDVERVRGVRIGAEPRGVGEGLRAERHGLEAVNYETPF